MKRKFIGLLLLASCTFASLEAQEELGYQVPKKALLDMVDIDLAPAVLSNSDNSILVMLYRPTYKSIKTLSRKELRIAGLRVDPQRFIGSRSTYYNKLTLVDLSQGKTPQAIQGLPDNPQLSNFNWSPDEKRIAMTHTSDTGVELWILDLATKTAKPLVKDAINATMGNSITWLKDSKGLLVKFIPKDREALIDQTTIVPSGPKITENNGEKAQNRTYQDLIKNPTDAKNFTQLSRSELRLVDMDGKNSPFLENMIFRNPLFFLFSTTTTTTTTITTTTTTTITANKL